MANVMKRCFPVTDSINCVEHYEERGTSLFITLSSDTISRRDHLALKSILQRYNQDPSIMNKLTICNPLSAGNPLMIRII